MFSSRASGFTILEILIVLALLGLMASISMMGFKNFASYQQYNQAVGDVQFSLQQTRLNARSAVVDQPHGIHILANSITQFYGDIYNVTDTTNEVILFELVTLQADLTGGVQTIVFDKLTGIPSATGTIIVSGTAFESSTTIKISDAGVIQ